MLKGYRNHVLDKSIHTPVFSLEEDLNMVHVLGSISENHDKWKWQHMVREDRTYIFCLESHDGIYLAIPTANYQWLVSGRITETPGAENHIFHFFFFL